MAPDFVKMHDLTPVAPRRLASIFSLEMQRENPRAALAACEALTKMRPASVEWWWWKAEITGLLLNDFVAVEEAISALRKLSGKDADHFLAEMGKLRRMNDTQKDRYQKGQIKAFASAMRENEKKEWGPGR